MFTASPVSITRVGILSEVYCIIKYILCYHENLGLCMAYNVHVSVRAHSLWHIMISCYMHVPCMTALYVTQVGIWIVQVILVTNSDELIGACMHVQYMAYFLSIAYHHLINCIVQLHYMDLTIGYALVWWLASVASLTYDATKWGIYIYTVSQAIPPLYCTLGYLTWNNSVWCTN